VIPFGIDVRPFAKSDKILRGVEVLRERHRRQPIVFSLGRHVYYKGFEVLIRAMSRIPAVLLLGGEGPLTPKLREIAATSGGNVEFVGRISEQELPIYYHAADVVCVPSVAQTEAFGLVQAEAMACAKPVVNTMLGNGVNELAPHEVCALTVPPGDESQLADALSRILSDRVLAERLGVAGRKRVLASYTVDAMVNRTLELYEMLLTRRRGSG
jgi:rhamnosyl/mannosyltransferase